MFDAIFGFELDGGKEWRRKSLGAGVNQPEHPWEVRERLPHRLLLRVPKATLDILGAYGEALFRAILGLELDGGKEWRRKSLGAGVTAFTGSESDGEALFRAPRMSNVAFGTRKSGL